MLILLNVKQGMGQGSLSHCRLSALSVVVLASGGHCHADSGGPSEGPPMKKEHKVGVAAAGFALLAIIGIATGGGKTTPTSNTSPIASSSALASAVASPAVTVTSAPAAPAATATRVKAKPRRTTPPPTPAPATSKAVAVVAAPPPPPTTTAPAAAPTTRSGCYPLTNGGNCYEPGEYCRKSDHGASGVAGDGEQIVCEDNNGWRWEPV